jgi:hypothetical protein
MSWVDESRNAAKGQKKDQSGYEVLKGVFPPVLDGDGVRGIFVPSLGIAAGLGARFRMLLGHDGFDPIALILIVLSVGLLARGSILFVQLLKRLQIALRARQSALVLSREGLFFTDGTDEQALERTHITSILEAGVWQSRRGTRRWSPIYVVGSTPDALLITLPPIFEDSSGVLVERLMRWQGVRDVPETITHPAPAALASQVYDDATRGIVSEGTLVVRHGNGWLTRGPYASLVLAGAIGVALFALPAESQQAVWPITLGAIALAILVPLGWIWTTRREISVRRGIAMVLTPAEVLMRTRAGVHRAAWPKLQRTSIDQKRAFSLLGGMHMAKTLVLKRKDDTPIRYDEAYLGVPVEVAQVLIDAYRRGELPMGAGASEMAAETSESV